MQSSGSRLRVATYNVHACVGTDRRHDPDRVASVVGELNADIVALQEFTYAAGVSLETRQPVELVALDGYACALGPTREIATRCFGNALLTRHPIVEVHRLDLSLDGREPRGALAATVDVGGTPVHVLATHLGLRVRERRFQVPQLLSHLGSVRHSLVVVLGDINDWLPLRSVAHVLDRPVGHGASPAVVSFVPADTVPGPHLDPSGRGAEGHVRASQRVGASGVRSPPGSRRHRSRSRASNRLTGRISGSRSPDSRSTGCRRRSSAHLPVGGPGGLQLGMAPVGSVSLTE
jgi:endonuclease/exonuclease/phosphatase family metal-dependent hydrolase